MMMDDSHGNGNSQPLAVAGPLTELTPLAQPGPLSAYDRYNMHFIYSPPWLRRSDREATDPAFLARTTPRRRALSGDYERPDALFGAGMPGIPTED
jgi:hypothetical protein